jgi:hypothetical protein
VAAFGERLEATPAQVRHQAFGQDRARGVSGADE